MTVFLVHPVRDDVSDALRFGQLRAVNGGYVYGDQIDDCRVPEQVRHALWQAAKLFNPGSDYLLIAGDHVQVVLLSAMLATVHPFFDVLRWERQASAYMPVRIVP